MPRVPASSIPSACDSPPQLGRRIRRWFAKEFRAALPLLATSAIEPVDRYRKHFFARTHAALLLFHGLTRSPSLRQTYTAFADSPALIQQLGAGQPDAPDTLHVSFSQVAASSHTRPPDFVAAYARHLMARVAHTAPTTLPPWLDRLLLLDSTCLRLSAILAKDWLPARRPRGDRGVRLHVEYRPAADLPETFLLTSTKKNDVQRFDTAILDDPDRLATLAGQTLAFDLGFYSHARFAQLGAAGIHFVTRTHPQATITVTATLPVPDASHQDGDFGRVTVTHDEQVTVGSPNNRAGAVLAGLRWVTATVTPTAPAQRLKKAPVTYTLLTDRWDLTAAEVVLVYLVRWQIELFFRWLKSHIKLTRLLGYSEAAVQLSIWVAICVHLLSVLAARALGWDRRTPVILVLLGRAIETVTLPPAAVVLPPPPIQPLLPGFDTVYYPLLHPS